MLSSLLAGPDASGWSLAASVTRCRFSERQAAVYNLNRLLGWAPEQPHGGQARHLAFFRSACNPAVGAAPCRRRPTEHALLQHGIGLKEQPTDGSSGSLSPLLVVLADLSKPPVLTCCRPSPCLHPFSPIITMEQAPR